MTEIYLLYALSGALLGALIERIIAYRNLYSEVKSLRSAYEVAKDRKYKLMAAEKQVKDLEIFTQHLMDKRAKLLTHLRKNGIKITKEDMEDTEQWGQKEYEHYKSKL